MSLIDDIQFPYDSNKKDCCKCESYILLPEDGREYCLKMNKEINTEYLKHKILECKASKLIKLDKMKNE